jgi:hypothetical protein
MSQTAVLVWLSASAALPTFQADLTAFAHSRLLRLEPPPASAPSYREPGYARDLALQIEVLLEEARNATASLEQSRALPALDRVEHLLREHPELPQAAWLKAEQLQLTAEVENTAPEGAGAAELLRKRAAAIEGRRAAPFSDHDPAAEFELPAAHPVRLEGGEPGDLIEWDSVRVGARISIAAGEHQARVSRNGRLVWAGWMQVTADQGAVHLPIPQTPVCSLDDIGEPKLTPKSAAPSRHTRCESYVLARAHDGGGVEIALCDRARCGAVAIFSRTNARPSSGGWPHWATYGLAASAAVVTTGLILWRVGVFDRPEPHTTSTFIYAGQESPLGFHF